MVALLIANAWGLLAGVVQGNSARYVIGDTVNQVVLPTSFIVGYNLKDYYNIEYLSIYISLIYISIATLTNEYFVLTTILPAVFIIKKVIDNEKPIIFGVLFLAPAYAMVSQTQRKFIVGCVIFMVVYLYAKSKIEVESTKRSGIAVAAVLLIAAPAYLIETGYIRPGERLQRSVQGVVEGRLYDVSMMNRVFEVIDASSTLSKRRLHLIGAGNGALWEKNMASTSSKNIASEGVRSKIHHIHITGGALYFRAGIMGLIAYVMVAFSIFYVCYRVLKMGWIKEGNGIETSFLIATAVTMFAIMTIHYRYIFNPEFGILIGILSKEHRRLIYK